MRKLLVLLAIVSTLAACNEESAVPLLDEQATCEINGGTWREFIACDEDGNKIDIGGACDCTPVVIGMGVVCEKAMNEFFDEDL